VVESLWSRFHLGARSDFSVLPKVLPITISGSPQAIISLDGPECIHSFLRLLLRPLNESQFSLALVVGQYSQKRSTEMVPPHRRWRGAVPARFFQSGLYAFSPQCFHESLGKNSPESRQVAQTHFAFVEVNEGNDI